jgi:hypothetical protein
VNDQTAYFGDTACDHLASILESDRPLRIFAVLDRQAYANSGAKDLLETYFSGNTTTRFTDFEPNPKPNWSWLLVAEHRSTWPS